MISCAEHVCASAEATASCSNAARLYVGMITDIFGIPTYTSRGKLAIANTVRTGNCIFHIGWKLLWMCRSAAPFKGCPRVWGWHPFCVFSFIGDSSSANRNVRSCRRYVVPASVALAWVFASGAMPYHKAKEANHEQVIRWRGRPQGKGCDDRAAGRRDTSLVRENFRGDDIPGIVKRLKTLHQGQAMDTALVDVASASSLPLHGTDGSGTITWTFS